MTPQYQELSFVGLELERKDGRGWKYIERGRTSQHYQGFVDSDTGRFYIYSEWRKHYAKQTTPIQ